MFHGCWVFPGIRFHRLAPPGDESGVFCDENGPAIGAIRLLTKTAAGFAPRPIAELNTIFTCVVGLPVDCSDLTEKLTGVATALNKGELARATFATLFMHLPSLSEEQARRTTQAQNLFKASPDDTKHPGWPKWTEGGKGGQFRPKDESAASETSDKLARQAIRQRIRRGLLHILLHHSAKLALDAMGDAIPGADVVAGAATVAEFAAMAEEFASLKRETDARSNSFKKVRIVSNNYASAL